MDIDFPSPFTPAANEIRARWNDQIVEDGESVSLDVAIARLNQRIVDVLAYAAQFEIMTRVNNGALQVITDEAGKHFIVDPSLPGSDRLQID